MVHVFIIVPEALRVWPHIDQHLHVHVHVILHHVEHVSTLG